MSIPGDILILCDFDGTVCTVDMGNEVLNRFTDKGWEESHKRSWNTPTIAPH